MHRFVIVATSVLLLVGCPKRHTGGPETPSGNDLLLNRIGYPTHVTSPQRCPSPNAEVPHGKLRAWWRNGKKRAQGEFAAGQMIGCWETWHDNGQKESEGAYAEGRKVKDCRYWSATGQKREEKLGGDASQGKCGWM
jgi:hypothetical protein